MVADGARADLFNQLFDSGELPNIKKHIVDRGCLRTALTVFPSTTGPAHIPFVTGLHPGTANIPGYRWLDRDLHDRKRRSIYRHRSLNSPRGLMMGKDMHRQRSTSLYEYFDNPSSILELVDYCPDKHLYKLIARRLYRIVRAHQTDDWSHVDNMVERLIIKRVEEDSECIIGSFFGIDEYSHLYSAFGQRTIDAYRNIDRAVGRIAEALVRQGVYEETILAIVSDHGLSDTGTHIPVVDIVKEHDFDPYYYPKLYRRSRDSAVMESGNAMAMLYFKRGEKWGVHWRWEEMKDNPRIASLLATLKNRPGISFVCARDDGDSVVFASGKGLLTARRESDLVSVSISGQSPLPEHPTGKFKPRELFEMTYDHPYPDAVNQLFMLFASRRSGDIVISSDPGYDLRLQHEDPEHHGSHGSLHREHMQVPLAFSAYLANRKLYNYDIVPTILHLCGKIPKKELDGRILELERSPEPAGAGSITEPSGHG